MRPLPLVILALAPTVLAPVGLAQEPDEPSPRLADFQGFVEWLRDYRSGAVRVMRNLQVDEAVLQDADDRMAALSKWNDRAAAQKLFEAATVDPQAEGARSSSESIDFQAELQPWKIRAIARRHIASMSFEGLEEWLIGMVNSRNLRSPDGSEDRWRADAALQVLGLRDSPRAKLALFESSMKLPPKLRLRALDQLSEHATLELVEHFVGLLRDTDPNMRIAALNSIGKGLGPHTDETEHEDIPDDVARVRDTAIARMKKVLERDKVWQVRAAACQNLAALRCKQSIPALIDGLKAELRKNKEPWAMDLRIHRTLERTTGVSTPPGSAKAWEQFWRENGASMQLAKPHEVAAKKASADARYQRFFSLELDSDRLLFVVDFSGSMLEDILLKTETTAAKPGVATTKARLVVSEMKKIIMSLPDGSWFNIVVFSDSVRVWRPGRDGRPTLVRLNDETRDDLLGSFLDGLQPRGPTNLHGALDKALDFAGYGLRDKHYGLEYDTIYVLSDGAPSWGAVIDKDEIRRIVRETNRLKKLTIHAVTFGDRNDTDFLRLLAEENGGRHVHVE